jgi:phospholipase C
MNQQVVRWIFCGALIAAIWGFSSCASSAKKAAPTITFSASTGSISSGQSVTLNWQALNATSVTITASDGSSSRSVVSGSQTSGTVQDTPTKTTTYTAVAAGPGGSSAPQTATVQVATNLPPQITSFTAKPTEISAGQTTTLTWATTNATSVTITPAIPIGDDSGPLPTSGSVTVPVSATTPYSITATGPGGAAGPQTVTVTVPFTLSLTASPGTIAPGQMSTLSWQITGGTATAFTLTDASGNSVCTPCTPKQGTATVTPGTTTTYTATATTSDGTPITQSATVTVSSANTGVIKHIFFLLQENRSFDMYLGQLGAYRSSRLATFGITDTQTIDAFDPTVTLTNAHTGAKVQPFHEPTVCIENLTPSWDESHHDTSLKGGDAAWATTTTFTDSDFGMASFLDTTSSVANNYDPNGTRVLGYYNQQDLPYYYDLATFFPTSDAWHSPILANTVPNRMYLMAATSFGHELPDNSGHPLYAAPTIFRAMNTANVSWLYYYKDGVFLANFADFSDPKIQGKVFPVSDLMSRLGGTCSGGPCDPDQALPQVIFIDSASGASGLDEHPDNNVQTGAFYVQSIISALMSSNAWHDSVFILSYDEGGGLYDHVPPFMVPPPDTDAPGQCPDPNNGSAGYCTLGNLGGTFNLTGFRVPIFVVSPYAKPNFVSHIPRDYTAILAFIEKQFGMPSPLTARDAYWQDPSRDMSEFFDFTTPAMLNAPNGQLWTQVLTTQPTTGTCDPKQEAGPTQ